MIQNIILHFKKSTPGIPVKALHILACKNLQDISSDQQVPRRP